MTSFGQRVAESILNLIRAREASPSAAPVPLFSKSSHALPRAKVREVSFSDYSAVARLKQRWDLIPESFENWKRFWTTNPALKDSAPGCPMGWVLDADGQIVGYLGNIVSTYTFAGRKLYAVTSTGFVVEPEYRSASLTLLAAFFRQKSDLYLGTTAIPPVGKMARALKSDPLPQPDYDTVLFWVINPRPFTESIIRRLKLQSFLGAIAAIAGGFALGIEIIVRRRWPQKSHGILLIEQVNIDQIVDDFESFWIQKSTADTRLLADRSPESVKWHFSIPGDAGKTDIFCCRRGTELLGYAVIRSSLNPSTGIRRTLIADMFVKDDEPTVIRSLLSATYDRAKVLGSDVFEMLGFPENIRKIFAEGNPYSRKYPATPFYYKASDPVLHKALSNGKTWYATPFDGDTTLMP